jgi:hypothetical protein
MNAGSRADVWKASSVVKYYFEGTRRGIPLAAEQFDVTVRLLKAAPIPVKRFLDLGCGDGVIGHVLLQAFPESSGVFVNLEHVAPASAWVESLFDELMIDTIYAAQEGKTRGEVAEAHHSRADKDANILAPVELQCQWLREIGFEHVDCYLKIFELAVFGGVRPLQ